MSEQNLVEFKCKKCGYSAEVSGGKDLGMVAVVQTMTCHRCRELVDVLIGERGVEGPTGCPDYDKNLGICPKCHGKDVVAWQAPWVCPKCEGRMKRGKVAMLWD